VQCVDPSYRFSIDQILQDVKGRVLVFCKISRESDNRNRFLPTAVHLRNGLARESPFEYTRPRDDHCRQSSCYGERMTAAAKNRPEFLDRDAARLAGELYGIEAQAHALPSERDQNFHLHDGTGAEFVLKIGNSAESIEILEF